MYTNLEYRNVEPICYEIPHTKKIVSVIKENFNVYFNKFIESEAGNTMSSDKFIKLQENFNVRVIKKNNNIDYSSKFKRIIAECVDEFEKDRTEYLNIFDMDILDEYRDDLHAFKSDLLRTQCPIIRKTLNNRKEKVLDKYRTAFNISDPEYLLNVVTKLCEEANNHVNNCYRKDDYDKFNSFKCLNMEVFDSEECTAYGVIGGGIKSLFLFKFNPEVFSSRSRSALWALWYLTKKESFGCRYDSEFLMIDTKKSITQQNYFYPYELFHFYAYEIFKMLDLKAKEYDVSINPTHRYVIVDKFFEFIANEHNSEISQLEHQIKESTGVEYA